MGNTESTEGNKQRISLIIICANTLANNERGTPCRKEYARRKTSLFTVFAQ
jgi:hypothetical protein